jgi:3-hydroxyisobutyrate dehydrogenase-like beta-hydroxyacid dehydrogenase
MARNLIKSGHALVFFARRDAVAHEFESLGATRVASPAEVAAAVDTVVTIVSADDDVRQITLGPDGIIEAADTGKTLIDMSTIGPDTTREVAQRLADSGMDMLDAPVSGGPWGAEAATLTIMVGGQEATFRRCLPVLNALGEKVIHVGAQGAGQTVKVINQMIAGGIMALTAEGFVLGKACGLDLEKMVEVISLSSGNSTVFEARGKKFLLAGNDEPGFRTDLMRKDVALAVEMGRALGVSLPVSAVSLEQYTSTMNQGYADRDFSSIAKIVEAAAGQTIVGDTRQSYVRQGKS